MLVGQPQTPSNRSPPKLQQEWCETIDSIPVLYKFNITNNNLCMYTPSLHQPPHLHNLLLILIFTLFMFIIVAILPPLDFIRLANLLVAIPLTFLNLAGWFISLFDLFVWCCICCSISPFYFITSTWSELSKIYKRQFYHNNIFGIKVGRICGTDVINYHVK